MYNWETLEINEINKESGYMVAEFHNKISSRGTNLHDRLEDHLQEKTQQRVSFIRFLPDFRPLMPISLFLPK
jgi:hypothetical protein